MQTEQNVQSLKAGMSQCPYYCPLRDFHPETTIFDKAKTTNKQTLEGSSRFQRQQPLQRKKESVSVITTGM